MSYRVIALLTVLLALSANEAMACSCAWRGNFVEYAQHSQAVVKARIASYGEQLSHGETLFDSMKIEVVSVLKGGVSFESIVLLGDPGFLCRDYVDSRRFVIGKEYVIALHEDSATQAFGGCGEAWLEIDGDLAVGTDWNNGEPRGYSMPLEELLIALESD